MAVITGYNGSIRDTSGNAIGEITSFSLNLKLNNEQHTTFGDAWTKTTPTNKGWVVEGSGMYDPDDTYQAAIVTDVLTGDGKYVIECRPEGNTTGDKNFTGTLSLADISIEASAEGVIAFSFSGTGDGACTEGTVS